MIRCESCSSASLPKVMHPRHNSETIRPVFPKRRYSINVRFPFFFVQTIVPYALSQCDTYEQHDSEAMEGEVRRCAGYVRRVYGLRTSWLSPRVAQRDTHPKRSGSGTCFVAFIVFAERRNFSHIESRVNKVSEIAHEAVSCSTVCLLSSRCATRRHDVSFGQIGSSVTNFFPLPCPVWETVSQGAPPSG